MENLIYLTDKLPTAVSYTKIIAKRLNERGLKPSRGETYTPSIVRNVAYGRSRDENVRIEIIALLAEHQGKEANVKPYLDAAKAILNAAC